MVTNHLGIYKEWVPWKEVFGPQGDMEMLRQEPLVSSKGSSDQEWGLRDFPGCSVIRALHFPMQGIWVRYLVRELRSHMPRGMVGSPTGLLGSLHVSKPHAHVIFITEDFKE